MEAVGDLSQLQRPALTGSVASVGLYTIQIAALHGFEVVTTCSARHFDLVKRLGAAHAFDYYDDDVIDLIKKAVPGIKYVFDTIGNETSSGLASRAIDGNGGGLCTVRLGKANINGVTKQTKVSNVFIFTAFLKEHRYGKFRWPVSHYHYCFCDLNNVINCD